MKSDSESSYAGRFRWKVLAAAMNANGTAAPAILLMSFTFNFDQIFVLVTPSDNNGIALRSPRGCGFALGWRPRLATSTGNLVRSLGMPPRGYAPWGHPSLRSLGWRPRLAGRAKSLAFRQNGSNVTLFTNIGK